MEPMDFGDVLRTSECWHERIASLRKELCELVTELSTIRDERKATATLKSGLLNENLDAFFASISPFIDDEAEDLSNGKALLFRGVTPLVVACDRGNLACLLYFCRFLEREVQKSSRGTFWEALIGSPLKSKTAPDETTALHHCTSELAIQAEQREQSYAGGTSFLELLKRIFIAQESLRGSNISPHSRSGDQIMLVLGEAVNSHGDTPLMMAVANNIFFEGRSSAKAFLERWYTLALEECNSKELESQKQNIKRVLTVKNAMAYNVLSYAWERGIVDLVQWFMDIDDCCSSSHIITSDQTLQLRKSTDLLRKKVSTLANGAATLDQRNMYEKKLKATAECTQLLESHVQKRSERMTEQLLEELEGDSAQKSTKRKKKKKKKQQGQKLLDSEGKQSNHSSKGEELESPPKASDTGDIANPESKTEHTLSLTKLANGRLAVKVPGQQPEKQTQQDVLPSAWYRKRTFSLDETNKLLRDRYKQLGSTESSTEPTPMPPSQSSDADSVLSALCLDVNCLLYSDHGMALNLSPAQLDAVEHILKEQLESVAKARILQERRSKSAVAASSSLGATNDS